MIRFALFLTIAVSITLVHAEETLSRHRVLELVQDLSSKDKGTSARAFERLTKLRSNEDLTHLMHAQVHSDVSSSWRALEVFQAIGEPAVEAVFSGSVDAEGSTRERIPGASSILTNYLKTSALPSLMAKLRSNDLPKRRKAAWAIKRIIHYNGIGDTDPQALAQALHTAATQNPHPSVRAYCVEALRDMGQKAALPKLIALLAEQDSSKVACEGLAKLGKEASDAVARLERGILDETLPTEAVDALIAIVGADAVPFVVENLPLQELDVQQRWTVSHAFTRAPHPAAIPFIAKELWDDAAYPSSREMAGRFFAAIDHATSLTHLRECLRFPYPENSDGFNPLASRVRTSVNLRTIAIRYLGARHDTSSFPAIARMLRVDPSLTVRRAAADVLGEARFGGEGVVSSLRDCLLRTDHGYPATGHGKGSLHKAAVNALANIGSDEALKALFEAAVKSPAKSKCAQFWLETENRKLFEKFLAFARETEIDNFTAHRVIVCQLRRHRESYDLADAEVAERKDQFLLGVRDPEYFGIGADLSMDGRYKVQLDFEFYSLGYAIVTVDLVPRNRRDHAHGPTVLYKKEGESWLPVR